MASMVDDFKLLLSCMGTIKREVLLWTCFESVTGILGGEPKHFKKFDLRLDLVVRTTWYYARHRDLPASSKI